MISERNQAVIDSFKKTRSQAETAKLFNLTRERIRQIVTKYGDNETHYLLAGLRATYLQACSICGKALKTKRTKPRTTCENCYAYSRKHKNGTHGRNRRWFESRGNCPRCGVTYTSQKEWRTRKIKDMCGKCFSLTPEAKKMKKRWFDSHRDEYYAKLKAGHWKYQYEWAKRHPERMKAYRKRYWNENKLKVMAIQRRYYLRNQEYVRERGKQNYIKRLLPLP